MGTVEGVAAWTGKDGCWIVDLKRKDSSAVSADTAAAGRSREKAQQSLLLPKKWGTEAKADKG